MPIYVYKCQECGNRFEEILSVADGDAREFEPCPDCDIPALVRLIGIPAVHMRYSPMHPRHMRGQRGFGNRRK